MVVLAVILVPALFGKEAVYLNTGFSLEVDSHTQQDGKLVCRVGMGTLELPNEDVLRIEPISEPPVVKQTTPVAAVTASPQELLDNAANDQGIDEDFIRSVAKVESGFRQTAISPKGAIGLMQLMPETAAELGVHANQAQENARGGAKYLRQLLLRYHGNSVLALAAYNAGPEAVARFGGVPPYPETVRYVSLVLREYNRQKMLSKVAIVALSKPSATN